MNNDFHNQTIQNNTIEEQVFKKYKKNFLPIFLKGYEQYLKNKKDQYSQRSLYQKVDNVFNNLKVQGNVRCKYGIKLIKDLLKTQNLNFIRTVNDYRSTYAPLHFMKNKPKNLTQYMQYLKEPFPPNQLENHLENKINNKNRKTTKTNALQIDKQIQKPQKGKNIYRDLNREIRKIINYKGNENVFELNQKGLYDFFIQHIQYFIADKYYILQKTINEYLNRAQNDNQRNKIKKYLDYVNNEIRQ